jgi:hypothetical protein
MTRPHRWFRAAELGRTPHRREAAPRIHAKAFGTDLTACGVNASNMLKEWDQAFDRRHPLACQTCSSAITTKAVGVPVDSAAPTPVINQ